MKEKYINIGDNIRKFRELKNLTRDILAAELNMSLSGYSKIERNEVDLTISRMQQIAQILEVDISQILNFDASQLFHINRSQFVTGFGSTIGNHQHPDEYKEKYIQLLELENKRLRKKYENAGKEDE